MYEHQMSLVGFKIFNINIRKSTKHKFKKYSRVHPSLTSSPVTMPTWSCAQQTPSYPGEGSNVLITLPGVSTQSWQYPLENKLFQLFSKVNISKNVNPSLGTKTIKNCYVTSHWTMRHHRSWDIERKIFWISWSNTRVKL